MKTYTITFQRIQGFTVEVEAETEDQALELAKETDYDKDQPDYIEYDYYEAVEN